MPKNIERKDGYIVVTESTSDAVPLTCPICDIAMATQDDIDSYMQWSCCSWCYRMWVVGRTERWENGWRPERHIVKQVIDEMGLTYDDV